MSKFFEKVKGALNKARTNTAALKGKNETGEVSDQQMHTFETFIQKVCSEVLPVPDAWISRVKLSDSLAWEDAKKNWSDDQLIKLVIYCIKQTRSRWTLMANRHYLEYTVVQTMTTQLLRRKLSYSPTDLTEFFTLVPIVLYGNPLAAITGAAERSLNGEAAEGDLKSAIENCLKNIDNRGRNYPLTKDEYKIKTRLENLIDPREASAEEPLPTGAWLTSALEDLQSTTEKQRTSWNKIFAHALSSAGKSKPTRKWLKEAEALIKELNRPKFAAQVSAWFNRLKPDPEGSHYDAEARVYITTHDQTLDIAKGLMWMTSTLRDDQLTLALGRATETCYKKIAGHGARSKRLGNAGVISLALMDGDPMAVAELVRLKTQVKYPAIKKDIQKKLQAVADKLNVHLADLEEKSLPSFGLNKDGFAETELGDVTATISLEDVVKLSWKAADGKRRKTVPVSVKRDHAKSLKALKQSVKDISSALKTQIIRLEASWVEGRSWTIAEWHTLFRDHPLRRHFAKHLIWRVSQGDSCEEGMLEGDALISLNGEEISFANDGNIALWHPLNSDPEAVLAWRLRIIEKEIMQPIKQAHREVYVLTDAERSTDVYSNRFAAHILRQHQFRALCHARGWTFDLMGMWDSWNVPTRAIPNRGLSIEYHVDIVDNEEHTDAYVPLHLATDQVRFIDSSGERMRLESVEPILFSELLRDVDLFVAVTSVANDPAWTDGGPDGRHGGYWSSYAFGDLSQTAETRRELLVDLVPKLAISDKLKVTDKFLEVKGERNDYRIHLGSSNIQIMPSKQYLCIVRGRSNKDETKVRLPFAGDNMLSIILSKAFMLVADDKITDKTILSQLGRS